MQSHYLLKFSHFLRIIYKILVKYTQKYYLCVYFLLFIINMRKIIFAALAFLAVSTSATFFSSCNDTKSYADYVNDERHHIQKWLDYQGFEIAGKFDEEQINDIAEAILEDSISPSEFIELGKWYEITEGDFKRLCFRINSWGNDFPNMKSDKKFYENENVLVRYQDLYCLNEYDYDGSSANIAGDNLDPNSYEICYNWSRRYYSNMYYSYSYSTGSSYECTSGGLGFPIRFLWQGGDASIIIPFNIVSSAYSQYYYTLYYGTVRYTKPNYLPE